jgi:large subunit ribosomal protein L30
MSRVLKIRLIRSPIAIPGKLKKVVKGLGLRRINQTVKRPDNEATWGMVRKIPHMVEVTNESE